MSENRQTNAVEHMRAVGLANGSNPISVIVPCHRVIGADGSLTGYGCGLWRKRWLLRHEGVAAFQGNDDLFDLLKICDER
jgi:O-6-methylguanine DNA methyltransferase